MNVANGKKVVLCDDIGDVDPAGSKDGGPDKVIWGEEGFLDGGEGASLGRGIVV